MILQEPQLSAPRAGEPLMALSLMAENNDVRLAEQPAHSRYFMGTKWIDLWVVYMIFTQAGETLSQKVDFTDRNLQSGREQKVQIHQTFGRKS